MYSRYLQPRGYHAASEQTPQQKRECPPKEVPSAPPKQQPASAQVSTCASNPNPDADSSDLLIILILMLLMKEESALTMILAIGLYFFL